MKIYTRKGDDGTTGLVGGERVLKHDPRVELYGTCDELNSLLGGALAELEPPLSGPRAGSPDAESSQDQLTALRDDLVEQQNLLFELGSELAGFVVEAGVCTVTGEDIANLEARIDEYSASLAPLKTFILPGGSRVAAWLHVARTVCRRLERGATAALHAVSSGAAGAAGSAPEGESVALHPNVLRYVNRLSDYLFTAARYANAALGHSDLAWVSRGKAERARRRGGSA